MPEQHQPNPARYDPRKQIPQTLGQQEIWNRTFYGGALVEPPVAINPPPPGYEALDAYCQAKHGKSLRDNEALTRVIGEYAQARSISLEDARRAFYLEAASLLCQEGTKSGGQEMLSAFELAKRHGVDPEKLRKRLERWQKTTPNGWKEVADRRPREPKYLYRQSAVLSIIQELKTSGERPAKKSF